MNFVAGPVTVTVPATSANLGPGFDSLGLALDLHDQLTAEVISNSTADLEITVEGEGADQLPRDKSNLVAKAMYATFDLLGVEAPGLRMKCSNVIPHGRGLGSSAAAIVGGIVLARALATGGAERFDDNAAFHLANDLEGHPDNVAAAMFGGLTIAWIEGAAPACVQRDVVADVTVFIPATAVTTKRARELLPETVPYRDATANAGRSALLVAALDGAPEFLYAATEDRLHQRYRFQAMEGSHKLLINLRAEGVPTIISGAGPTVLCFAQGLDAWTPEGWTHHELVVDRQGATIVDR